MIDLPWIVEARKYIGQREIPGLENNSFIVECWQRIKTPWFKSDETPWCAGFVGRCLEDVGIKSTRSAAARSYLDYGIPLLYPAYGCIAVKNRYDAQGRTVGGHVTFVVGKTSYNQLMCLGGNQGDAVSIVPYTGSVFKFRMPPGLWEQQELPILNPGVIMAAKEA